MCLPEPWGGRSLRAQPSADSRKAFPLNEARPRELCHLGPAHWHLNERLQANVDLSLEELKDCSLHPDRGRWTGDGGRGTVGEREGKALDKDLWASNTIFIHTGNLETNICDAGDFAGGSWGADLKVLPTKGW